MGKLPNTSLGPLLPCGQPPHSDRTRGQGKKLLGSLECWLPGWTLGAGQPGLRQLGRAAQAGGSSACLPPVSLTGMDDIQCYSHRFPRLRGDTGLGVVLRCLQRRGWARASAWQGRGWVSNCERWAWVTHPLGWGSGVLQAARAERRSQ